MANAVHDWLQTYIGRPIEGHPPLNFDLSVEEARLLFDSPQNMLDLVDNGAPRVILRALMGRRLDPQELNHLSEGQRHHLIDVLHDIGVIESSIYASRWHLLRHPSRISWSLIQEQDGTNQPHNVHAATLPSLPTYARSQPVAFIGTAMSQNFRTISPPLRSEWPTHEALDDYEIRRPLLGMYRSCLRLGNRLGNLEEELEEIQAEDTHTLGRDAMDWFTEVTNSEKRLRDLFARRLRAFRELLQAHNIGLSDIEDYADAHALALGCVYDLSFESRRLIRRTYRAYQSRNSPQRRKPEPGFYIYFSPRPLVNEGMEIAVHSMFVPPPWWPGLRGR